MREITEHHDGHGLNEQLTIRADEQDPNSGGASHHYLVDHVDADREVGWIQFQKGPRNEPGSTDGITEAVLYAILLDRLRAFQAGPYPSAYNDVQIAHLEECLSATKGRANDRARRGVLGKNEK